MQNHECNISRSYASHRYSLRSTVKKSTCSCCNETLQRPGPVREHTEVPSLMKMAYLALHPDVRAQYDTAVAMKMDVHECCRRVKNIIAWGGRLVRGYRDLCEIAASHGHVDCLRVAHEFGCPWDESTCMAAARGNHMDCLVYAHEMGCPWTSQTSIEATFGGIECLRYAIQNGCPWNPNVCRAAAISGNVDCLIYARASGCQWDEQTCTQAALHCNVECLEYAIANGCPLNRLAVFRLLGDWHL